MLCLKMPFDLASEPVYKTVDFAGNGDKSLKFERGEILPVMLFAFYAGDSQPELTIVCKRDGRERFSPMHMNKKIVGFIPYEDHATFCLQARDRPCDPLKQVKCIPGQRTSKDADVITYLNAPLNFFPMKEYREFREGLLYDQEALKNGRKNLDIQTESYACNL